MLPAPPSHLLSSSMASVPIDYCNDFQSQHASEKNQVFQGSLSHVLELMSLPTIGNDKRCRLIAGVIRDCLLFQTQLYRSLYRGKASRSCFLIRKGPVTDKLVRWHRNVTSTPFQPPVIIRTGLSKLAEKTKAFSHLGRSCETSVVVTQAR